MTIVKRMYIVDQTMATDGGFIPHLAYADEGYLISMGGNDGQRPWIWGPSLAEAKQQAREMNSGVFGLSEEDETEILRSVIAAADRLRKTGVEDARLYNSDDMRVPEQRDN